MEGARAWTWVLERSGRAFAPQAMYQLSWHDDEDSPTWGGYVGLEMRVMNDRELLELEREHRVRHGLPERKPWETPMLKAAMGFSGRPGPER